MWRVVGEEGAAPPPGGASKHFAPGRTDGKSGIDQTDVRERLREGATLCGGRGNEMLGEYSDMIGSDEHSVKDNPDLWGPSQQGTRLGDPIGWRGWCES
jgi:hypothetical protein